MSKPELGIKRDCPECGARFYDLTKEPAHCPKCDHEFIPEALLKPRKSPKEETAAPKPDKADKSEKETSLESADKEQQAATSNKRASLDDDDEDDETESGDDELAAVGDLDVDDDEENNDNENDNTSVLVDDNDDDVTNIVKPTTSED